MEEEKRIYRLPINYRNPGKWKSIPIPNLIEGVIVGFVFEYFLMKIPFTFQFRIVTLIVTFSGIVFLFVKGVNGERVSFFILSFIKYLYKIVSNKYRYHMRKVGIKDVEALTNRNSDTGRQSNFSKIMESFNKRKTAKNKDSES